MPAPIVSLSDFAGVNSRVQPRFLPAGVGTYSVNQIPVRDGNLAPWKTALPIPSVVIPSGRQTIYRYGGGLNEALFWLSWPGRVHIVESLDSSDATQRIYYSGDGAPKWTDNTIAVASAPFPTAYRDLAIPKPSAAPTVTMVTDGATGEPRRLYYSYTWVTSNGWELGGSPPTLAPLAKPGAVLNLTPNEAPPSGNHGINRIRWYRTQVADDGSASFFFLREYAVGASGQQDDGRPVGPDILPTGAGSIRLPIPSDAKWLTYCWNGFAAAISQNEVVFCEPSLIYAWPDGSRYTVPKPIALAAFAQRLMVFTERGFEVFVGSDPFSMDQKPMDGAVLVSEDSVVVGDSFVMWAASDGLWMYGAGVHKSLTSECLTREQWAEIQPATIRGALLVLNERPMYFGVYGSAPNLQGFVVDTTNPAGFYRLSDGYVALRWDKVLRQLFVSQGEAVSKWNAGASAMTATFRGGIARQETEVEAAWLEILGSGSVKLTVDGVNVYEHQISTGQHRTHDGTQGREFQLEVSTTTSVQGVVLE